MCFNPGVSGGDSKLASIPYIYNEILRLRPDLHKLLCEDWPHMRPTADQGTANRDQPVGEVFYMPVWGGMKDRRMVANAQYNRTYIETALA